jgi:hypothetical protein
MGNAAGAFGIFVWAMMRSFGVELARPMVVNTLCVMVVFYVIYVRSFTWRIFSKLN